MAGPRIPNQRLGIRETRKHASSARQQGFRDLSMRVECAGFKYLDPDNQDAEDNHPSHAAVDGPKDAKIRPKLAEKYEWIVPPPNRYDPPD